MWMHASICTYIRMAMYVHMYVLVYVLQSTKESKKLFYDPPKVCTYVSLSSRDWCKII